MYGLADYTAPVAGKMRVTSGEGFRKSQRTTNGARMSSFHPGVDIAGAKPGDKPDILNITSGRVVFTGKAGGWGNAVIVENPDGYLVQYGHLDSIAVKVGDHVSAGGKIGVMGATGNVTGVHLDLIVSKNGKVINREGKVFGNAPASIANRAKLGGGLSSKSQPSTTTIADTKDTAAAPIAQTSDAIMPDTEVSETHTQQDTQPKSPFGEPIALLSGSYGLLAPQTKTENKLFSDIADMNLNGSLESIYAEAAKTIANIRDSVQNRPMLQSHDPIRAELSELFDTIDV